MRNLRDKELTTLFGKLSNEEAPVDKNAWEHIKTNINKPGHSNLGALHIKAITLGLFILVAGVSIWAYQKDSTDETISEKQNSSIHKEKRPTKEAEKQTIKSVSSNEKNTSQNLNAAVTENTAHINSSESQPVIEKAKQPIQTILPDSSEADTTIKETPLLIVEKQPEEKATSTPADSNKKTIRKDSTIAQNLPKPKASKKIIIVEEDTVVQVDTVFKKKRFRRKDD